MIGHAHRVPGNSKALVAVIGKGLVSTFLILAIVASPRCAVASLTPGSKCVDAKNKAATKAFLCRIKAQNKILFGGASDLGVCDSKLSDAFTKIEAKGDCPTTNDESSVGQRVDADEAVLLNALQANAATTDAARKCVAAKNKIAGKIAQCTLKAVNEMLNHLCTNDFKHCNGYCNVVHAFAKAEDPGACPTTNDFEQVYAAGLMAATNMSGADLRGVYLSFPTLQLMGANLTSANLSGVCLDYQSMHEANVTNADFTDAVLSRTSFTDIVGCPASLPPSWACRSNTLLGPAVNLAGADLTGADLSALDLSGADFRNAKMTGVNLSGATIQAYAFAGCSHNYPYSVAMDYIDLSGADLNGASIAINGTGVRATGLINCPASILASGWLCRNSTLVGPGADLSNVDLSNVDLTDAHLEGANVNGANLSAVVWFSTTCPDSSNSSTNGSSPESCCGDLGANVAAACSP